MASLLFSILTTRPIEDILGLLLSSRRGYDSGLITRHSSINQSPNSITVTSPNCGPSGSRLSVDFANSEIGGRNQIPSLSWSAPSEVRDKVKEWLVVSEDPDAPTGEPIVHGIYFGILSSKTVVDQGDFEVDDEEEKRLKGGFWYGVNRRGVVYIPPRPIVRHGDHRYFFSVIAVEEKIDWVGVRRIAGDSGIGKEDVLRAVEGKVLGWGEWVGLYGRT